MGRVAEGAVWLEDVYRGLLYVSGGRGMEVGVMGECGLISHVNSIRGTCVSV